MVKKGLFEYQWDVFFSGGSLPEKKMRYFENSSSTRFKVTKQNSHKKVLRKPFHVFITQGQVPKITSLCQLGKPATADQKTKTPPIVFGR